MRFPSTSVRPLGDALMPLLSFAWRLVLALTIARVLLVGWQWERVIDAGMLVLVLVQGCDSIWCCWE